MARILLTGATGALGSMLLPRLLAGGHSVFCLVRHKKGFSPVERIRSVIGEHKRVRVIGGDILEPRCGISDLDQELLKYEIDYILHCAASINFENSDLNETTNIQGVHNVLELAEVLGIWDFRHVSTSYVAGDAGIFLESDLYVSQRWRNSYEQTKYVGETMVRAWARQVEDRRFTIFRPSILIGCEDGRTPTFDAYYGYFKPIDAIAAAIRSRGGMQEIPVENGIVKLPIVLQASPDAVLNLVPIDWVVDTIALLLEEPPHNRVFHLVNLHPPMVRWVIKTSLSVLKIGGVTIVAEKHEKDQVKKRQTRVISRFQRQIDRVLDQYFPYVMGEPVFSMEMPQHILGARFPKQPIIDADFLAQLLHYAVSTEWGKADKILV